MAHYLATRMQKFKSQNLGGIQKHNQREFENHSNQDIDGTRSHLNYDLLHEENINYRDEIMRRIEEQKTSSRKTRKDAVLVNEFFVTSGNEFFKSIDQNEQKRFFETATKWFQERYGEQNIAYATVHNDETTSHMHIGVVPMRDGKLQSKNIFDRTELLAIQKELPAYMQSKGFDVKRGEERSKNYHVQPEDWKREQELARKEVLELRKEKENLAPEVANLTEDSISLKQEVETLKQEHDSLKGENELVRASLRVESEEVEPRKFTSYAKRKDGKLGVLPPEKYAVIKKDELDQLNEVNRNSAVLVAENDLLREENDKLRKKVTFLEKVQEHLQNTVKTARKRLAGLLEKQGVTQDVQAIFNQAMTYAHKFYSKNNSDVGTFVEKEEPDMLNDAVGSVDFEKWEEQRNEQIKRQQFNRGWER